MRRYRSTIMLAVVPAVLACRGEPYTVCPVAAETAPFSIRDSAGVSLLETECTIAHRPLGWGVDAAPTLELGGGDTDEQQFHNIRGVRGMPDGGVAVVDQGSREVRFYDSAGTLLVRRGGPGDGPGQFRVPALVPTPDSDSILVYDAEHNRFTWFSGDGNGSPQLYALRYRSTFPSGLVDNRFLMRWASINERSTVPGIYMQDVTYYSIHALTGEKTVLYVDTVESLFVLRDPETGSSGVGMPFAVDPSGTMRRTGSMLITSGTRFDVLEFDTTGFVRRIIRVDRRRRPVEKGDLEEHVRLQIMAGRGSERSWRPFAGMPVPDSMRAYGSLHVDSLDWLWAELYHYDSRVPSQWLVFDPDGRARGLMELPPGLRVGEIGEDYIVGTARGTGGIEYVRRYRLRRTG
jgi:hypothetical protein